MGLYTEIPKEIQEVDIIVAGGGTAGCIVAARLVEADPSLSILVIEGGQNNHNVPQVVYPAFYLSHLKPTSKTSVFYKSKKADQLAGREVVVSSGRILGGGSSINFCMYTRAQRSDFDSWEAKGWSAEELWPYLKKFETYHGSGESHHHGHDGPIHVSDGPFRAPRSAEDFIGAVSKLGWPTVNDLQTLDANNGISPWLRYISPDGKRQDTAHRYLHPKLEGGRYPNLHVLVESKVVRVLIDDQKRAVGVEYTSTQTPNVKLAVKARRLVVVSCGALGTPLVLERSGLGDSEVLKRAGVSVILDLPGVGREYQDHNATISPYRTNLEPHETLDGILSGRADVTNLIANKDKILGWNGIDVASKLRPSEADVDALGPEFRTSWDRDFKNNVDRPLMIMGLMSYFLGDHSTIPAGQYATVLNITAYPYSRGYLHITGPNLDDPLDFNVGFFTDAHDIDLKQQLWAYKKQREIMRRTAMYRGELAVGHPSFPEGSAAACVETDAPLRDVQDIKYSAADDKAIEDWLRLKVASPWHSLGTAKMAPRERFGVVNEQLSVHGVQGLKIADMSVSPMNMGANTENAALAIGEKAADLIISELGLGR